MSNGKGDKPRFYPNEQYRKNYDNIFRNKKDNTMKDKCVMCGTKTEYTKDTHIDQRRHYIEGAGQMCKDCHTKIY